MVSFGAHAYHWSVLGLLARRTRSQSDRAAPRLPLPSAGVHLQDQASGPGSLALASFSQSPPQPCSPGGSPSGLGFHFTSPGNLAGPHSPHPCAASHPHFTSCERTQPACLSSPVDFTADRCSLRTLLGTAVAPVPAHCGLQVAAAYYSFIHPFIYSFIKKLVSVCCVAGPELGARDS